MVNKNKKVSIKVDDVSKPGETPVSSNARPTITGHTPMVKQDPMVSGETKDDSAGKSEMDSKDEPDQAISNKPKITIAPLSDNDKSKDEKQDSESSDDEDENKEDVSKETKDATEEKKNDTSTDTGSESGAIDALAKTADSKKAESIQEEEKQKRKELVDSLSKEGKYHLPITEGGHKATSQRLMSWIFLFFLLVSIGVYLAIDAEYLYIGIDPPLDFIKN